LLKGLSCMLYVVVVPWVELNCLSLKLHDNCIDQHRIYEVVLFYLLENVLDFLRKLNYCDILGVNLFVYLCKCNTV